MEKPIDTYVICTICDQQFHNVEELNNHLADVHGRKKPAMNLTAAPDDVAAKVNELSAKNEALEKENKQINAELEAMASGSAVSDLKEQVKTLNEANKALKGELEDAQKANGDLAKKITELEAALAKAKK